MMVLIERVSFIVPFLASHNIKRSFADLHLLCFYIIGHCFCPGNLGEKKAVRQLKIEKKRCLSNRAGHCGFFYPQHSR